MMQNMRDIVAKCLVKDPARRPTAAQLLEHKFFKVCEPSQLMLFLTWSQGLVDHSRLLCGLRPKRLFIAPVLLPLCNLFEMRSIQGAIGVIISMS